jgi:hypothetical protein
MNLFFLTFFLFFEIGYYSRISFSFIGKVKSAFQVEKEKKLKEIAQKQEVL